MLMTSEPDVEDQRAKAVPLWRAEGIRVSSADVARLSPLVHKHINFQGCCSFALAESVGQGALRPLRDPGELDEEHDLSQVSVPLLLKPVDALALSHGIIDEGRALGGGKRMSHSLSGM